MINRCDYEAVERDINTTIANVELIMMSMLPEDKTRQDWQLVKDSLHDAKIFLHKIQL